MNYIITFLSFSILITLLLIKFYEEPKIKNPEELLKRKKIKSLKKIHKELKKTQKRVIIEKQHELQNLFNELTKNVILIEHWITFLEQQAYGIYREPSQKELYEGLPDRFQNIHEKNFKVILPQEELSIEQWFHHIKKLRNNKE